MDGLDWSRVEPGPELPVTHPPEPVPLAPPPPARGFGPRTALALAGCAALIGGLVSGLTVVLLSGSSDHVDEAPAGPSTRAELLTVEQTSAVSDVAARARPGVVLIESTKRTATGLDKDAGSGVVLDAQGHILTNAHVVLGTDSLRVVLSDGTERPAILLGHDYPFTDIAVLQISPGKLTPIVTGDSASLQLGQAVIAIGNPLAEFGGSVTVGVISGLARHRTFDGVRQDDLIQTDAAINSGNSGGALLNLEGQLVGIPTAVLRQSRSGQPVEGIAFALPSNRIISIAATIIATGSNYPRPSVGLDHVDLSPDVLQRLPRLSVTEGALVTAITSGGPADAAGLQPGDVITKLGDLAVNRDNPFLNALMAREVGETVRVVFNRNGRIIEVEVRLARRT